MKRLAVVLILAACGPGEALGDRERKIGAEVPSARGTWIYRGHGTWSRRDEQKHGVWYSAPSIGGYWEPDEHDATFEPDGEK